MRFPVTRWWKRSFPDAEVVILPDASHFVQEDAPDEIVRAVKRRFGQR